jgi:hypothetical protein
MIELLEGVLLCAIVIICIYVFSIYNRPPSPYNSEMTPGAIYEGARSRSRGKGKGKGAVASAAPNPPTDDSNPPTENKSPASSITGVGPTAKVFLQSVLARIGALNVELDTDTYESDYIQIIDDMKELMYKKALKSCLQYTGDSKEDSIHEMNAYISTISNLEKLSEYTSGAPSKGKTGSMW